MVDFRFRLAPLAPPLVERAAVFGLTDHSSALEVNVLADERERIYVPQGELRMKARGWL